MSKLTMHDVDTLARTVYGEARGESRPGEGESMHGRIAVALVVLRRWRKRNCRGTVAEVCRRRWQFSCWNDNDPNLPKVRAASVDDWVFRESLRAALIAIDTPEAAEQTLTGCADHYMTRHAFERAPPYWVRGKTPCAEIGDHVFFNNID